MKRLMLLIIFLLLANSVYAKKPNTPKPDKKKTTINNYYTTNIYNSTTENKIRDKYEGKVEIRIVDTKNTAWFLYYNYDFNNNLNTSGIKVVVKLGKSYTEKKIEELEKEIKKLKED